MILRKESFGGLLKNIDGKLFKVDDLGYKVLKLLFSGYSKNDIANVLSINEEETKIFFDKLENLGILNEE